MARERLRGAAVSTAVLSLIVGVLVGVAAGHAKLLDASPAPGSAVKAPPRMVRAVFNDELDPTRSRITVTDARGRRVDDGRGGVDLDDLDRKTLVARLRVIGPGRYTVRWRAVSADDGYVAQGTFWFVVTR
jgi:methionine-rich copper-binding protein CopC